jgi:hypothetical protein
MIIPAGCNDWGYLFEPSNALIIGYAFDVDFARALNS